MKLTCYKHRFFTLVFILLANCSSSEEPDRQPLTPLTGQWERVKSPEQEIATFYADRTVNIQGSQADRFGTWEKEAGRILITFELDTDLEVTFKGRIAGKQLILYDDSDSFYYQKLSTED